MKKVICYINNNSLFIVYQNIKRKILNIHFLAFMQIILSLSMIVLSFSQVNNHMVIYDEAINNNKHMWHPEFWNNKGISYQDTCHVNCRNGNTCIKIIFDLSDISWNGITWLPPEGSGHEGFDLYDYFNIKRGNRISLSFWARGETGDEKVRFLCGGGYCSIQPELHTNPEWITLTRIWHNYRFDLTNLDLSRVSMPFKCGTELNRNRGIEQIIIYLDDIKFE